MQGINGLQYKLKKYTPIAHRLLFPYKDDITGNIIGFQARELRKMEKRV